MLESAYADFLAAEPINENSELSSQILGYMCRSTSKTQLATEARRQDVHASVMVLRTRLDYSHYATSRFWRAIWSVLDGTLTVREAADQYRVERSDIRWVIGHLTSDQRAGIRCLTASEWIRQPDNATIDGELHSMFPYCERYVRRHMRFIARYDAACTVDDLAREMFTAGVAAAYRYDWRFSDPVHLRNIAWRSANHWAVSRMKSSTARSRARVYREQCEEATAAVKHWKREGGDLVATIDIAPSTRLVDSFRTTTRSLSSPGIREPVTENHGDSQNILVEELCQQTLPIRVICAAALGTTSPTFERWLGDEEKKPNQLIDSACRFYGVDLKELRAAMRPVLCG